MGTPIYTDNNFVYSTIAQIDARHEAERDRRQYARGTASEMDVPEPERGRPTIPPPSRLAKIKAAQAAKKEGQ